MKRTITLKSIKDPHTVEFADTGITREGETTSQRQALERVLAKRIDVVVDGKTAKVPVFLVEKVGPWTGTAPQTDSALAFDADVIHREHSDEKLAVWNKARDAFIAKSIEARRQAEAQMEREQSADIAKAISSMVKAATPSKGGARV